MIWVNVLIYRNFSCTNQGIEKNGIDYLGFEIWFPHHSSVTITSNDKINYFLVLNKHKWVSMILVVVVVVVAVEIVDLY